MERPRAPEKLERWKSEPLLLILHGDPGNLAGTRQLRHRDHRGRRISGHRAVKRDRSRGTSRRPTVSALPPWVGDQASVAGGAHDLMFAGGREEGDLVRWAHDETIGDGSDPRAARLGGPIDPLEDPRPCARRGSQFEVHSVAPRGDPELTDSPRTSFPARPARTAQHEATGLLQVAGSSLGARKPRRPRLSRRRRKPSPAS